MTIPSSDPASSHLPSSSADDATAPSSAAAAAVTANGGRRLALHFGVVLVGASVLAAVVSGPRAALSAGLGVTLAGLNLLLMKKITSAMTSGHDGGPGNAAWGLALPFKLVALVGLAYALVSSRVAQPVPLAMGFALLPLTGVFLPRPTSVPRSQSTSAHPVPRREPASSRRSQPAS
jgi:hypothetical protein